MNLIVLVLIFAAGAYFRYRNRLHAILLERQIRVTQGALPILESAYRKSDPERQQVILHRIAKLRNEIAEAEYDYIRKVSKF